MQAEEAGGVSGVCRTRQAESRHRPSTPSSPWLPAPRSPEPGHPPAQGRSRGRAGRPSGCRLQAVSSDGHHRPGQGPGLGDVVEVLIDDQDRSTSSPPGQGVEVRLGDPDCGSTAVAQPSSTATRSTSSRDPQDKAERPRGAAPLPSPDFAQQEGTAEPVEGQPSAAAGGLRQEVLKEPPKDVPQDRCARTSRPRRQRGAPVARSPRAARSCRRQRTSLRPSPAARARAKVPGPSRRGRPGLLQQEESRSASVVAAVGAGPRCQWRLVPHIHHCRPARRDKR